MSTFKKYVFSSEMAMSTFKKYKKSFYRKFKMLTGRNYSDCNIQWKYDQTLFEHCYRITANIPSIAEYYKMLDWCQDHFGNKWIHYDTQVRHVTHSMPQVTTELIFLRKSDLNLFALRWS